MKKMHCIVLFLPLLLFVACEKQAATPNTTVNQTVDSVAKQQFTGSFSNGMYGVVMGNATIYHTNSSNVYTLLLDSFTTSNGPDLHVYLSKEQQPVHFIDLGKLQSTNGSQVYAISGTPNFTEYGYVLIHCQQYNHLFGAAKLH